MDGKVLGIERRRRWSKDEKARIVEATLSPGAVASEVARRRGAVQSLLLTWRRLARTTDPAGRDGSILLPVEIDTDGAAAVRVGGATIARGDERTTTEARNDRNRTRRREPRTRRQGRRRRRASSGSERSGRTMIPTPSGVRVWIAAGRTDMRRGMQGLALQVQEPLTRDPHGGDPYIFRGRRGWRRSSGATASGYRCMRSGSTVESSSGHRRRRASCRFRQGGWPTCLKGSTGGIRS